MRPSALSSAPTKQDLRREVLRARADRDQPSRDAASQAIIDRVLDLDEIATAETVAAYVSTAEEPSTNGLLDELHERGIIVLLPVVLDDFDLDWAQYEPGMLRPRRLGILEPSGERLGPGAITDADVVLCPGLAGSPAGARLGRGAGCYDRALTRTRPRALRALLVFDDEVFEHLPATSHDQRVDAIVTDARVLRITREDAYGTWS